MTLLHCEVSGDWTQVIRLDQKYHISQHIEIERPISINSSTSTAVKLAQVTAEVHSYACVRIVIAIFLLLQTVEQSKHLTELRVHKCHENIAMKKIGVANTHESPLSVKFTSEQGEH